MNLIIVAGLSEPPTESLPFRHVTSVAKIDFKLDILIEAEQEQKDLYFKYMGRLGLLDYIEQLITPMEREEGVRLDTELNYPYTIPVKAITFENFINIINQIKFTSRLL